MWERKKKILSKSKYSYRNRGYSKRWSTVNNPKYTWTIPAGNDNYPYIIREQSNPVKFVGTGVSGFTTYE